MLHLGSVNSVWKATIKVAPNKDVNTQKRTISYVLSWILNVV